VPLTFPSHQGLIAPLWRRWPGRFHILGLCIGAATPDVVDGILGAWRGYLGQWYGHSLVGLFLLCLPVGLALTQLTVAVGGRLHWPVGRLDTIPEHLSGLRRLGFVALSVLVGGFSHLVFDFISHGRFLWLYPWHEIPRFFPSWWYTAWFTLSVPGYREPYPIGPSMAAWVLLSVLGAVMLIRPWLARGHRV